MIPTSGLAVLIVSLEEIASKHDAGNVDCAENALQIERPLFRSAERLEHLRRIADETAREHHIQLGHDDEYDEPGFVSLCALNQSQFGYLQEKSLFAVKVTIIFRRIEYAESDEGNNLYHIDYECPVDPSVSRPLHAALIVLQILVSDEKSRNGVHYDCHLPHEPLRLIVSNGRRYRWQVVGHIAVRRRRTLVKIQNAPHHTEYKA